MVIPIENIPEYSSDWIIWFTERETNPDAAAALNVRAPIPLRKFESVEPVPPGARTEIRVQLAGIINKAGKLEVRALLRNLSSGARKRGVARHSIVGVQAGHARWSARGHRRRDRDSVQPAAADRSEIRFQQIKKHARGVFAD